MEGWAEGVVGLVVVVVVVVFVVVEEEDEEGFLSLFLSKEFRTFEDELSE